MVAAFVERDKNGYGRVGYIVLRIDADGAKYLRELLLDEMIIYGDSGAREIHRELTTALAQWEILYGEHKEDDSDEADR